VLTELGLAVATFAVPFGLSGDRDGWLWWSGAVTAAAADMAGETNPSTWSRSVGVDRARVKLQSMASVVVYS
jgi:hypothetical protein